MRGHLLMLASAVLVGCAPQYDTRPLEELRQEGAGVDESGGVVAAVGTGSAAPVVDRHGCGEIVTESPLDETRELLRNNWWQRLTEIAEAEPPDRTGDDVTTLLVPTDAAFAALDDVEVARQLMEPSQLTRRVWRHVVDADVPLVGTPTPVGTRGGTVIVAPAGSTLCIGGALVTAVLPPAVDSGHRVVTLLVDRLVEPEI